MNDKLISGKEIKTYYLKQLKQERDLIKGNISLKVILIGENQASLVYVNNKEKLFREMNIPSEVIHLDENISEKEVISLIKDLNQDINVTGILLQLPLPSHLDSNKLINLIDYKKDVDGLTSINAGKLVNKENGIIPCTAKAVMAMLEYKQVEIKGKHVVIVGRSLLVGKPLISLFLNEDATVTVCHSKTKNISNITKQADILVVAIGQKEYITEAMVKEGSLVIDVGINRFEQKLYGDVDFDNVINKASLITPVPGGVGVMTVTMLVSNILSCYYLQQEGVNSNE